jgi:hypothetical protein
MRVSRRIRVLGALAVVVLAACGSADATTRATPAGPAGTLELGALPGQAIAPTSGDLPSAGSGTRPATAELPPYVLAAATPRPVTDPRVFLLGDSVLVATTLGSPDALDTFVGSLGWQLTVDAETGRFADQALRIAERRADEIHQVLVLMLGNNYRLDAEQYRAEMEAIIAAAPALRRVLVFTVPRWREEQAEVNQVLYSMAAADDRILLVEWERATREFPRVLGGDGLHPTTFGAELLAQLIANALGLPPGARPGTALPDIGSGVAPTGVEGVDKGEPTTPSGVYGSGSSSGSPSPTTAPRRPSSPTTSVPPDTTVPDTTPDTTAVTSSTVDGGPSTTTGEGDPGSGTTLPPDPPPGDTTVPPDPVPTAAPSP